MNTIEQELDKILAIAQFGSEKQSNLVDSFEPTATAKAALTALIERERVATLKTGVYAGWNASGEGYNSEYAGPIIRNPSKVAEEIFNELQACQKEAQQ